MKFKKISALILSAAMLAAALTACNTNSSSSTTGNTTETTTDGGNTTTPTTPDGYGLTETIEDGTILHCFSWSFKTITESMEDIAMAGFSAIQTSPVNLCYDGGDAGMDLFGSGKWYYHYQPIDWTIGNYQLGTEEEFEEMCKVADSYGVKVIVDVVPNHTTKSEDAISEYFIEAVGGKDKLYHSNGLDPIVNYGDRGECTLQAMAGLYDVNTENPKFQDYFIDFLNQCIDYGVDGFRYDTAKHIGLPGDPQDDPSLPNNFWERVTTEINNADTIFNYGEVLQGDGERIKDYIDTIGATTASSYGGTIRSALLAKRLSATNLSNFNVGGSSDVVTWVESHDNYTEDSGTAGSITNEQIIIGWSVLAAREKGTPLFFARPYGATKDSMWGTFNKIGMAGDNLYKDPTVVAVNRFRNAMVGEAEKLYNAEGNTAILFIERGTKGLVIINISDKDYDMTQAVNLANGSYLNRADNETTYTVADGTITGKIPAGSVVVLCNEGYCDLSAPSVKVADDTTGNFMGESIEVELVASNTTKATYSLGGGAEVEFKTGDKITIGADLEAHETVTLTLRGSNDDADTCITYIFKKLEAVSSSTVISFKKPDSWGSTVYAYVYDETSYSSVKANASWPGVKMTDNNDGTFSYQFTEEWIAPLVIFTDGAGNQSNGAMEPGAAIEPGKLYTID